jgi:hypothetical protein
MAFASLQNRAGRQLVAGEKIRSREAAAAFTLEFEDAQGLLAAGDDDAVLV